MHNNNTGKTLLVLGGSGLVGMEILRQQSRELDAIFDINIAGQLFDTLLELRPSS